MYDDVLYFTKYYSSINIFASAIRKVFGLFYQTPLFGSYLSIFFHFIFSYCLTCALYVGAYTSTAKNAPLGLPEAVDIAHVQSIDTSVDWLETVTKNSKTVPRILQAN